MRFDRHDQAAGNFLNGPLHRFDVAGRRQSQLPCFQFQFILQKGAGKEVAKADEPRPR